MLSTYSTANLIAKWGKVNGPTTEQMIGHILQNMLTMDEERGQNSHDLIFQQKMIEEHEQKIEALEKENESLQDEVIDLKARVKLLEEHASLRRKENGQE